MGKILGIDLGTTNSAMAVWDGHEPRLIVSDQGTRLTPSVVGFSADDDVFVGEVARCQAVSNPKRTITSAKRFIGRQFDAVAEDRDTVPYEVVRGDKGEALFLVGVRRWSPEEICGHILGDLKRSAEAFLGEPVNQAVVAVPAYFNDAQRAATKEAARLAGLDVLRIVNEPTAAALAYGLHRMESAARTLAVYDFGGGTFDVSVLSVGDDIVEVIATHGDTHLGGDDIDARIAMRLVEQFEEESGQQLELTVETLQRLMEAAEHAKVRLSNRDDVAINLPFLGADKGAPQHFDTVLTRAMLDEMISDLVDRTLDSCTQALKDAGKLPEEIDEIVLVGGSSRVPLVRRRVAEYFGKEPRRTVDPDEVVALGAAVQAGILSGELKGIVLVDVTSLSLGIEIDQGNTAVVIPRNTTIPAKVTRRFTTTVDGQTGVWFHVVQGESERAELNQSLGRFDLVGLAPAKAGTSKIEVTFAIDANGMVKVSACDIETGNKQTVTVSMIPTAASQKPGRKAVPKTRKSRT